MECDFNLKLRLVLDFPQLFTAYNLGPGKFTEAKIIKVIRALGECRDYIAGIHLWGKKLNDKGRAIPHIGDLDSYFLEARLKEVFCVNCSICWMMGSPGFSCRK